MSWADSPEKLDVLNLPHERAILASVASEHTSQFTAPFRLLVQQAKGLDGSSVDDVNKRIRLRFWKMFWDINRCSYLSWKLGIAHGDTNLSNIVYDERDDQKFGILNDYDLAALTEPSDRRSSQSRLERMGTIPFMTIDVLDSPNGELKRWYRHDLEASAWCLAYHMLSDPPKRWSGHNFNTVSYAKAHFLVKAAGEFYKEEWKQYTGFLHSWMRKWADVQVTLPSSLAGMPEDVLSAVQQQGKDTGDDTYIRTAIIKARSIEGLKFIEALNDTSWINVQ